MNPDIKLSFGYRMLGFRDRRDWR